MKIIPYLCRAERQVLAKAYASSLDLNLNATSSGIQVCRTSKPRLCVSSIVGCQLKQHSFFACVYRFSTTTKQPSTVSANEEKKCLVKSGKVRQHRDFSILGIPVKSFAYTRKVFWVYAKGCENASLPLPQ